MQRIDRYEVRAELGRGGAGAVYEAWDPASKERVALKVLLANDPRQVTRFRREARILERLDHPHVIPVRAWGEDRGRPYLVMDLIQGQTLDARVVEQGTYAPTKAAELGLALAQALLAAHEQGILHRDVKPSNVLLRTDGSPVLTDFGLAKEAALDATQLSVEGGFMGTLGYVAPEQALGQSDHLGPRTDVYGLGATLYFALTGVAPVAGNTVFEVLDNLQRPPEPLARLRPDVPPALAALIHRCLRNAVHERYRDCSLVARDLARFLTGDLGALSAPPAPVRRPWALATAVGVAAVSMTALLWPSAPPTATPSTAQEGPQPAPEVLPALRAAAHAAVKAEDWSAARRACARVVELAPRDPEALHGLWKAMLELGDDEAPSVARRAVAVEPRLDAYLLLLGALRRQGAPPERVETFLRDALRALPAEPQLLQLLGQHLHLLERNAEALPLLLRAKEGPPSFALDMLLGGVLVRLHRDQEALDCFVAAERRKPDSLQALYYLGYTLIRLRRFEQALAPLERAYVLSDGDYAPVIPLLADTLREVGACEDALRVLDRALAQSPQNLQLLLARALTHDEMGNSDLELADLDAVLALDPDQVTARHNRSVVYFARGDYAEALADAQREVTLSPDSVDGWTQVGGCAFALEQNALARDAYSRAIELDPEEVPLRIGRGQAAQLLGEWDLAIADFSWALARLPPAHPSRGSVRFNMAMTYDSAGQRGVALETMRQLERESAAAGDERQEVARYWIERWTQQQQQEQE